MITRNGIEYRNLVEQVQKNKEDIARHYEESRVLADYGITIVANVSSVDDLPDPLTYTGVFGDAYAVGPEGGPYEFYIYTRPNDAVDGTENRWLNIGQLAIAGPEGPMGPQGPQGPAGTNAKWYSGYEIPVGSGYSDGDMFLSTNSATNGYVYRYADNMWTLVGNIRGPQGIQGPKGQTGPQGPQGVQGPQGPQGSPAPVIEIIGTLTDVGQLPSDTSELPTNAGYLVSTEGVNYLYIIIDGVWVNSGRWGGGSSVYSGGQFVENFDADTKLSIKNYPNYSVVPLVTDQGTKSGGGGVGYMYLDMSLGAGPTAVGGGSTIPTYYASSTSVGESRVRNRNLLTGTPTQAAHAANKKYVDEKIAAAHEGGFQPHTRLFAVKTENADEPPQYTVYAGLVADNWDYQGFINFPVESLVIYQSGNYTPMAGAYTLFIERVDSDYFDGLGSPVEWSLFSGNVTSVSGDGYVTQSEYEGENQTIKLTLRVLSGADEAYIQITQYPGTGSYVHY